MLLDHAADLPPVLRTYATTFEIRAAGREGAGGDDPVGARELQSREQLTVNLSRRDLETLIRNLSGLPMRPRGRSSTTSQPTACWTARTSTRRWAQKRKLMEGATAAGVRGVAGVAGGDRRAGET